MTQQTFAFSGRNIIARAEAWFRGQLMSKRSQESIAPVAAKKGKFSDVNSALTQNNMQIDEDLHSRQLAVYGRASMRRMAASDILICGARGLGVETG